MEEGDKNTGNINSILQNKNLMAVIVIAIVVALGLILYMYFLNKEPVFEPVVKILTPDEIREKEINSQLSEMMKEPPGSTEQDINKQLKSMVSKEKQTTSKSREEEINKQLQEMLNQ
ncbi:MAG: hypothetical protein AAB491_01030 [Patescibacteria group bacterium]